MPIGHVADEERGAYLCDVGSPGHLAAVAVSPDGNVHLVLVALDSVGDDTVRYDCTCAHVGHEQTGPLPDHIAYRLRET